MKFFPFEIAVALFESGHVRGPVGVLTGAEANVDEEEVTDVDVDDEVEVALLLVLLLLLAVSRIMNRVRPLEPPQISVSFAAQGMLQRPSVVRTDVVARVSPQ